MASQETAYVSKGCDAELKDLAVAGVATFAGAVSFGTPTTTSAASGLTALAGGAQAGTPLASQYSRFTVVVTAGDSAQLPLAVAGTSRFVKNTTAASMNIFPKTGEFINALAVNTAFALASVKSVEFRCVVTGTWDTLLTA